MSSSTPVVVFAHILLWMVYEKWGCTRYQRLYSWLTVATLETAPL
jgi:hypothetical protein